MKRRIYFLIIISIVILPVSLAFSAEEAVTGKVVSFVPGNMHIGRVDMNPFLRTTVQYNDNIFLQPEDSGNRDHAVVTTVSPGFNLKYDWQDNLLTAGYRADMLFYDKYSNQDNTGHTANANLALNFRDFSLSLDEQFNKTALQGSSEFQQLVKRYSNSVTSILSRRLSDRGKVNLGYRNQAHHYIEHQYNDLNYNVNSFLASGEYKIFPKTNFVVDYNHDWSNYDDAVERNSQEDQILFGVSGQLTGKMSGYVKGGFQSRRYTRSSTINDQFNSGVWYINLTERFTERTTLILDYNYTANESVYENNNYYISNGFNISLEQAIWNKIKLGIGGNYQQNQYETQTTENNVTAKRRDNLYGGNASLIYQFKDWISFGANYNYKRRDSRFSNLSYNNNIYTLNASAAF